jgi:flagellar hook-basal body complex protein FliE
MTIQELYSARGTLGDVEGAETRRAEAPQGTQGDFAETLGQAVSAALAPEAEASRAVSDFVSGSGGKLHETLLALDKADISFKFLVSVRNRVIDAYREIMRMGM